MNGSRPVPPPLNFPFRSRRKSYSSDIDERPGPSIFPAVTNTTSATSTRRVGYGYASSTSTSSSPVASSPPPSSSLRSLSYAHAYDVHIRRHSSPHHTHAFYAPTTEPFDHDIAWQNDLVNMDKPLLASPDPSHRAHLGHGARGSPFNGYPFAYQYAIPRSSSFAVSDESEDPPTTSDFDIPSGYSDDMDVDLDSDISLDLSPPRRRISFSTSAERDTPFVRPPPPPPLLSSVTKAVKRVKVKSKEKKKDNPTTLSTASRTPTAGVSTSAAEAELQPRSMLPTPPASSPENETPPAPTTMSISPETRRRTRPTLMDLLSSPPPSPTKAVFQPTPSSSSMLFALSPSSPLSLRLSSPLPDSSPTKESSPLHDSSPMKEMSPLPDSSPIKESSPLPDSSPMKDSSSLPASPVLAVIELPELSPVQMAGGGASSLPTPVSPKMPSLSARAPLPESFPSFQALPSTIPSQVLLRSPSQVLVPLYSPSPSQMPLTPPSPELLPSSPSAFTNGDGNKLLDVQGSAVDAETKEVSPLVLDGDGGVGMSAGGEVGVEVAEIVDEVDEQAPVSKAVRETPSRMLSHSWTSSLGMRLPATPSPSRSRSTSQKPHTQVVTVDIDDNMQDEREDVIVPVASTSIDRRTNTPELGNSSSDNRHTSRSRFSPPAVLVRPTIPVQPSSRAVSPSPTPSMTLSVKREEISFSSPLSQPDSPLSPTHHTEDTLPTVISQKSYNVDESQDVGIKSASRKRSAPKSGHQVGPARKRSRVDTEEPSDDEDAEDEAERVKVKTASAKTEKAVKVPKPRGRKPKAKSVAPEAVADDYENTAGPSTSTARTVSPEAQPQAPRKRGRKKRHRSLSPSPDTRSLAKINWSEEAPMPLQELEGMIIETLATARATSMSASNIYSALMAGRPTLNIMPRRTPASQTSSGEGVDLEMEVAAPLPLNKRDWLHLVTHILTTGHLSSGIFGRVDSSASDSDAPSSPSSSPTHISHKAALLAQWFYVPEKDADKERASVIKSMMRGPGKRSETMKYKQYYWKPLGKISRWDPEDDL